MKEILIGNRCALLVQDVASYERIQEELHKFPKTDFVIGDSHLAWDFDLEIENYTLPLFFLSQIKLIPDHNNLDDVEFSTLFCFNFMINKRMLHRYLTARLVEYFGLVNFDYTYSGSCLNVDDTRIFQDLDICDPDKRMFTKQTMSEILGDVTIPIKFLGIQYDIEDAASIGSVDKYGGNIYSWQAGLDQMFRSSLISLVTESNDGHYSVFDFSEKTLYAILGSTMPIWPGAYKHAEQFELMGFDAFNDIINHDYQYEPTMFMRCYRAFADNIELLSDLSHAKTLRNSLAARFAANRSNLQHGVKKYCREKLQQWPSYVRDAYVQFGLWID